GDIGAKDRPVVADPTPLPGADYVQIESTYGDRDHKPQEESLAELLSILEGVDRGQNVAVIPAFPLGRTQELLYRINGWKSAGKLRDLTVYVDSPLATRVTAIFRGNPGAFDEDAKGLLQHGDDPFDFEGLHYVGSADESEKLSTTAHHAAFVASSGMCQSG